MTQIVSNSDILVPTSPLKIQRLDICRIYYRLAPAYRNYIDQQTTQETKLFALIQCTVGGILGEGFIIVHNEQGLTTYKKSGQLISFVRQANGSAYALAEPNNYLEALHEFSSEDFSERIVGRLADLKIARIVSESFNGIRQETTYSPANGKLFSPWEYYHSYVVELTTRFRQDAPIMGCPGFETAQSYVTQMKVDSRSIQILRALPLIHYVPLLEHFSRIYQQNGADFTLWSHWKEFPLEAQKSTYETCLQGYFEGKFPFLFYFQDFERYLRATSVTLISGTTEVITWSGPVSAQEVADLVKRLVTNAHDFVRYLQSIEMRYVVDEKTYQMPYYRMLSGRVETNDVTYFLHQSRWLQNLDEYFIVVEEAFRALIHKKLLRQDDPRSLPLVWGKEHETIYNNKYGPQPNFAVGDQVYFDSMQQVELFDLMRFCPTKPTNIYLYAVKEGLGQTTRDAVSQIRNSAAIFHGAKDRIFAQLQAALQAKNPSYTPEMVSGYLKNKKIVFVYAFTHSSKKGSLSQEAAKSRVITREDLSAKTSNPDAFIKELIQKGYLSEGGRVTNKLLKVRKEDLKSLKPKRCREHVLELAKRVFDSQIIREELVTIAGELKKMGFGFRICEIPKSGDQDLIQPFAHLQIQ